MRKKPGQRKPRLQDRSRDLSLGTLAPARQILFLLRSELIDLDAHSFELQAGDALVEFDRHGEDLLLEILMVLHQVLAGERLVSEAHVHH